MKSVEKIRQHYRHVWTWGIDFADFFILLPFADFCTYISRIFGGKCERCIENKKLRTDLCELSVSSANKFGKKFSGRLANMLILIDNSSQLSWPPSLIFKGQPASDLACYSAPTAGTVRWWGRRGRQHHRPASGTARKGSLPFRPQGKAVRLKAMFWIRIRIRIGSEFNRIAGSGSGTRRAKMTHKHSLEVLYGGRGISKLQFLIKKRFYELFCYNFFLQFLVIKTLIPDPQLWLKGLSGQIRSCWIMNVWG
jgi:hypothetical protein